MITTNTILRTFNIWTEAGSGTAFVLEVKVLRYLITALHVIGNVKAGDKILMCVSKEGKWKSLKERVQVVGATDEKTDIAVLVCPEEMSLPIPRVPPLIAGLGYEQDVRILGFPLGLDSGFSEHTFGFPVPAIKAGIISAFSSGEPIIIYIDAHGSNGISGGPLVICTPKKYLASQPKKVTTGIVSNEFIAGVVTNNYYSKHRRKNIYDYNNKNGKDIIGYYLENPGIIEVISIKYAIELIESNPIGLEPAPFDIENLQLRDIPIPRVIEFHG